MVLPFRDSPTFRSDRIDWLAYCFGGSGRATAGRNGLVDRTNSERSSGEREAHRGFLHQRIELRGCGVLRRQLRHLAFGRGVERNEVAHRVCGDTFRRGRHRPRWRVVHSPRACTAVGYTTDDIGVQVTVAETWNGTSWVSESTPDPDGATSSKLTSVSCGSAGSCMAVGSFVKGKKSAERAFAEDWNGTTWTLLKTGRLDQSGSVLDAVSCPQANACIGVGSYLSVQSDDWETLAEMWNGSSWSVLASPNLPTLSSTTSTECRAALRPYARPSGTTSTSTGMAIPWAQRWRNRGTVVPGESTRLPTPPEQLILPC